MKTLPQPERRARRGAIAVLAVFLLIGMVALLAFALDTGVIYTRRTELQRTADAAAIAATWRLLDHQTALDGTTAAIAAQHTQTTAEQYAELNPVGGAEPSLAEDDVVVGHLNVPSDKTESIDPMSTQLFNAVSVRVQRTTGQNGQTPLFFGRALGRSSVSQTAEATAAFWCSFQGFQIPSDGSNLGFLPLAMDKPSWDLLVSQWQSKSTTAPDAYTWNEATKSLTAGKDGIPEGNLYPQGTGSPGNRGTVDVGSSNNSTADLVRQITQGVSQADLDHIGGELRLNSQGVLLLNGDTGISAAIKSALDQIKGKPRVIPIFSSVSGNGNNAMYTIVGFGGVRIMDVKLTGSMSSKKVTIQPSGVQIDGGIPYTGGSQSPTLFIYSPVVLVR